MILNRRLALAGVCATVALTAFVSSSVIPAAPVAADAPMDTPEACFDRLVRSISTSDFDRFYSCHTKARRTNMLQMRDLFFSLADRMAAYELTITSPPDRTRTETAVSIRISTRGDANGRSGTDTLRMVKEDNEWRLNEPFIR